MPNSYLVPYHGRPQGGGGGSFPPPETEGNCCRKMVLFPRAVKNYKGPGIWDRKWVKSQFSIEIFICKFQSFLNKFQSPLVLAQTRKELRLGFLNSFRIIKELH